MNTHEILKAAKKVIKDPEHWTRETFARDAEGRKTRPNNTSAVCWCAIGAISKVTGWEPYANRDVNIALSKATCAYVGKEKTVESVNDDGEGHPGIMKIYDIAIEATA